MKQKFNEIERMHDYISGGAVSSAIYVATKLGIADYLAEGPKSIEQLAKDTQVQPNSLNRLMRALAGIGIFKEEAEKNKYSLTSMGATMRSHTTNTLRNLILMWGDQWHCDLWKGLEYSVKTSKPYFREHFGEEFFTYIQLRPEIAKQFHSAMSSLSSLSNYAVANKIDFSQTQIVADIGGGEGGLLLAIIEKWPHLRAILYDIESAIEKAKLIFSEKVPVEKYQMIAGDFFVGVPEGADAYILKHVLHGLDINQSIKLLTNIKNSSKKDIRIFIIEMVMPESNKPCYSKFNDLEMMLFSSTGCERSIGDFNEILTSADLTIVNVQYIQMGLHVIEAKKL